MMESPEFKDAYEIYKAKEHLIKLLKDRESLEFGSREWCINMHFSMSILTQLLFLGEFSA